MTVKELRSLLQSVPMERGMLSKLKRKQDMIDFLKQQETMEQPPQKEQLKDSRKTQSEYPQPKSKSIDNNDTQAPTRIGNMPPLAKNGFPENSDKGRSHPKKSNHWRESLYKQYPPLRDLDGDPAPGLAEDDIRQMYHPIMKNNGVNVTNSDMEIITIGTASCIPGTTRGVSCTALRLQMNDISNKEELGTWLFDAGECTQLQAQRTTRVRLGKISKIFVTHNHGDHTFGLPGILCLMGQNWDHDNDPPIDIYGPAGLRMWLRVAIRYSVSRIIPPYRVHELHDVPYSPSWRYDPRFQRYRYLRSDRQEWRKHFIDEEKDSWTSQSRLMPLEISRRFGELQGGRDIYPDYNHPLSTNGAPVWEVLNGEIKVYAAPMSHTIPCLGFVVKEKDRKGRLRNDVVEPIVRRNIDALREAGFRNPMKAMAVIKNLEEGASFTFPDGTVVHQHEAVEPPRPGRKVVICGDTADASALTNLGKGADVLVHEATNTYIEFFDVKKTAASIQKETTSHGHSTPQMAAQFAKAISAKKLVLNHFSPRYKGDAQFDSISIMTMVERLAQKAAGMAPDEVVAAWDFMLLPIHSRDSKDPK
eukprot:CAMPEP_0178913724 /NCGR_PEP_ID=MMETSP0786-20121207/11004_1 /TAXON_ID=186022 /ORGANISM="Thalassionema frauenfeldii, Strain CCMP 1798" /LENGTH=587 /DNA_ID=CAMNT_0020586503 /DNA_START=433 /DNA_END=2196 /DNA_ORIENTATION=-